VPSNEGDYSKRDCKSNDGYEEQRSFGWTSLSKWCDSAAKGERDAPEREANEQSQKEA
jgi:uncharacterized protein with GYD domain